MYEGLSETFNPPSRLHFFLCRFITFISTSPLTPFSLSRNSLEVCNHFQRFFIRNLGGICARKVTHKSKFVMIIYELY
ncbi:hypothetical protein L6452_36963 [Arctium lappa]|uniref:Uncharacterized protein n=1 Tax=Arctium lappa TaxID=4217 RepID=A0ACB8Y2E9_ARCLA|nr:hypothetical protein L6452_36963 [Arctium lappa]